MEGGHRENGRREEVGEERARGKIRVTGQRVGRKVDGLKNEGGFSDRCILTFLKQTCFYNKFKI